MKKKKQNEQQNDDEEERRGEKKIVDRWSRNFVDVGAVAGTLPTAVDC